MTTLRTTDPVAVAVAVAVAAASAHVTAARAGSSGSSLQPVMRSHELHFASLHHPGRAVAVPCDASGQVDLDALNERLKLAYFGARALIGRDYAYPKVQPCH